MIPYINRSHSQQQLATRFFWSLLKWVSRKVMAFPQPNGFGDIFRVDVLWVSLKIVYIRQMTILMGKVHINHQIWVSYFKTNSYTSSRQCVVVISHYDTTLQTLV